MAKSVRIGIVASEFHNDVMALMLAAALDEAKKRKLVVAKVARTPGAFELPLAAKRMLDGDGRADGVDGVVALGCVVKGGTNHDEIVAGNAARKLADLMVDYGKPIGLGVMGPGVSKQQARERAEGAARGAVAAVAAMANG